MVDMPATAWSIPPPAGLVEEGHLERQADQSELFAGSLGEPHAREVHLVRRELP